MATITELYLPELGPGSYGWVSKYPKTGPPFTLPAGKFLFLTPKLNVSDEQYISKGLSGVNLNAGISPNFLPFKNRGVCMGTGFIKNYAQTNFGGKPLAQFTESEVNQMVDAVIAARDGGYGCWTSQAEEAYGGDVAWKQEHGSQQELWLEKRIAQRLAEKGGVYPGTYDGHMGLTIGSKNDAEQTRNAWLSPAAALAWAKTKTPFGNRFYTGNFCQFRDGIIKVYFKGASGVHTQAFETLAMFVLDELALVGANSPNHTWAFGWLGYNENTGYSAWRKHFLPSYSGGYYEAANWPVYSFNYMLFLVFMSLMIKGRFYGWETEARNGDNPDIIEADTVTGDGNTYKYYGSGSPVRGTMKSTYDPAHVYSYPTGPQGFGDAGFVAGLWVSQVTAWAGVNWTWIRTRTTGSYNSVSNTYLLDCFVNDQGYAMMGSQGNRRWIAVYNSAIGEGQFATTEFDIGGGQSIVREVPGCMLKVYLIEA